MSISSLSPAARLAVFAQGCAEHCSGQPLAKTSSKNVIATIVVGIAAAAALHSHATR